MDGCGRAIENEVVKEVEKVVVQDVVMPVEKIVVQDRMVEVQKVGARCSMLAAHCSLTKVVALKGQLEMKTGGCVL